MYRSTFKQIAAVLVAAAGNKNCLLQFLFHAAGTDGSFPVAVSGTSSAPTTIHVPFIEGLVRFLKVLVLILEYRKVSITNPYPLLS